VEGFLKSFYNPDEINDSAFSMINPGGAKPDPGNNVQFSGIFFFDKIISPF
jgi:hypothetical protein